MHVEVFGVNHATSSGAPDVSAAISITPKGERRSSLYLTRFEVAKIVGERARQISSNNMLDLASCGSYEGSGLPLTRRTSSEPAAQKWNRPVGRSPAFIAAEKATNPLSRVVDPVMIAKHELVEHRIPLILMRKFPDGRCEYIPVRELEVDETLLDLKY
mmetsp:Transcript_41757/g.48403  ORF Transcript_41757/g.48403 Transcript_41757/m.48403 type:complete len:159 (-) Transcript_41757:96-572(-)